MTSRLESQEEAAARLAAERLTAEERAVLWQRLEARVVAAPRRRQRRLVLAFAAPAFAIAALCAALWWARDVREPVQPAIVADGCAVDTRASRLRLAPHCAQRDVQIDGDEWSLAAGAEVMRVADGARVVRGRVRFHVRPRTAQTQFHVHVSHGDVRVVGTVFQIEQLTDRGSIAVTQGVIEFVWQDGTRQRVAAGQTLHWPRQAPAAAVRDAAVPEIAPAPEPAPTALPNEPERSKSAARVTAADIDRTLDRLLQLQSQKRYPEAAALLRETLRRPGLTPVQHKRIQYELDRIAAHLAH